MKPLKERVIARIPKQVLVVLAVLTTLCIAVDEALHASHIMVFFSIIILSVLFFSLYEESEKHRLGVSIVCLVLGTIYLAFDPIDFTWWRITFYSGTLYLAAILFFASWLLVRHRHHKTRRKHDRLVRDRFKSIYGARRPDDLMEGWV